MKNFLPYLLAAFLGALTPGVLFITEPYKLKRDEERCIRAYGDNADQVNRCRERLRGHGKVYE